MNDPNNNPQYMAVGAQPEHKSGGMGWLWGLIIFLVLAAAIVFLILWLVERGKTKDDKELLLTGTEFQLTFIQSTTAMMASWTDVANDKDEVILYVYESGKSVKFNSDGSPTSATTSNIVATSNQVNGNTTKSLTASPTGGLKDGVTYIGVLVVTNPDLLNFHTVPSQGLFSSPSEIPKAFLIESVSQPGEIIYVLPTSGGGLPSVEYDVTKEAGSVGSNLFHYDTTNNLLCTIHTLQAGAAINTPVTCDSFGPNYLLYDNNGTLDLRSNTKDKTQTDDKWIYDRSNNRWCLTGDSDKCFVLPTLTGTATTSPINVSTTTDDATGWINKKYN